jgi:predicted small integral membrane protein
MLTQIPSTTHLFRIAKLVAIASIGLMAGLISFGNISDYYSNYQFVVHVMKMDTIFPDSALQYRSIQQPALYHTGYIVLIVMETVMALLCISGTVAMFRNLKKSRTDFYASQKLAVAGLIIGLLIWFTGFEVIGGEWFAMWQSNTWNGLGSADRILTFLVLTLILLHLKEEPDLD